MPNFSGVGLTAPLTTIIAADSVLSADRATLYVSGIDGKIRVYDVATRTLEATWDVGIKLGGIDLSPDGTFLVTTETSILGGSTMRTYRVDAATGGVTAYTVDLPGGGTNFFDAAILADGSVLLTQDAYSAHPPLVRLDLVNAQYNEVSEDYTQRGRLVVSDDRTHAVFTGGSSSNGPIVVYESGIGVTHAYFSARGTNPGGFNNGVSAISLAADLIVQHTSNGTFVYDASLLFLFDLNQILPGFLFNLAALEFDATGENLFILTSEDAEIIQVSTADWSIVNTIPVGHNIGLGGGDYGNRLHLLDDGLTFLVATATGIDYVEDNRGDNDFTGSAGNDILFAGEGADIVSGIGGNDTIGGGAGDDVLHGGAGDDLLDPGTGSDIANGGGDLDTLAIDWSGSAAAVHNDDPLTANAGEGGLDGSFTNDAGLDVVFTSIEQFELTAGSGDDALTTGAGNDLLNGGAGNDTLTGGAGNDVYYVDAAGDVVDEAGGAGNDRIATSVSYALAPGAEIERLETISLGGTNAIDLTGNGFGNILVGNDGVNLLRGEGGNDQLIGERGADVLVGGAGADLMIGGDGGDTYYVDDAGDMTVDYYTSGIDRVAASVSYALALGTQIELLEAISLTATDPLNLTGSGFANTIRGNDGVNILDGSYDDDILWGLGGDDHLIGGLHDDTMYGGLGNDTYYVDSAGDVVNETAGEGNDRIAASASFALAAASAVELIEAVNLTSTEAMNLTGSGFANTILGNDGVNILRGEGGNDTLSAFGGNDFLVGGAGADAMIGGLGDDTFYVDDATDVAYEGAGEGNDRIAASVSYVLSNGSEIERLEAVTIAATTAFDLTGSDSNNIVSGNNGINILRGEGGNDTLSGYGGDDFLVGGAGADAMAGGLGNDTYYVDNAGDVVAETAGEGNDRVSTAVSYALAAGSDIETLEAANSGDTVALDLTGNALVNAITGNAGANVIDGKGGGDVLYGLGGADTFSFTTALGIGNIDRIGDFAHGTDKIALDDAVFTGLGLGPLAAGAFIAAAQAGDADDRIVYHQASGQLFFDADGNGNGAAVLFATLDGQPVLTASDFIVI